MAVKRRSNKINKVLKELTRYNEVPSHLQNVLEERLVIAFTCRSKEKKRSPGEAHPKEEIRGRHQRRKAREVYLDILKNAPHVFLPFVLVTSPRTCENFDAYEFCKSLEVTQENKLPDSVKQFLHDVGNRHKIIQNPEYTNSIERLFPQAPTTEAESDESYRFLLASLSGIPRWFGNFMATKIESSPLRLQEITKGPMQTTECVRTRFPRNSFQDVIISIDVGSADELARVLFPHTEDHANSTSKGASVSAIQSIFPSQICDAIEKSDLRIWERSQRCQDSTDCVIMEGLRHVRLRVQYHAAIPMVTGIHT